MSFVGAELFVELCGDPLSLLRNNLIVEPAHHRIVVMGAGVGDAVSDVILRGVEVFGIVVAQAELEDSHAGEFVLMDECVYSRCDVSEVFDDYPG